jgi:hypothetical protein
VSRDAFDVANRLLPLEGYRRVRRGDSANQLCQAVPAWRAWSVSSSCCVFICVHQCLSVAIKFCLPPMNTDKHR